MIKEELKLSILSIDANLLSKMFLAGAKNLEAKKEWINELNVFPVPDGDTGTNMSMTILSAAKEVAAIDSVDMASLAKTISTGSLRGARGNSGVILSQLIRGFSKVIESQTSLDKHILAEAFEKAVETAYKAVMKPKEGTILTVAKGAADKAKELACDNGISLEEFVEGIVIEADHVLSKTPDMLPVLKEAGVVDSGGQGLVQILKGARDAFLGKEIDYSIEITPSVSSIVKITPETEAEITFGYCTEFIVVLSRSITEKEEQKFKAYLESVGDSIVVVADDEMVKVHVHTNDPGNVLQKALRMGSLSRIKIDNMREEHQEKLFKDSLKMAKQQKEEDIQNHLPAKDVGFIAVSVGEGLDSVFEGLGVDHLITGGQTMNPSTEDFIDAIQKVNAKVIFVLPNNSNIILAANQAASMIVDKEIIVIPSTTIPQGITALINYIPGQSNEENKAVMTEVLDTVMTGEVTYAVRNTTIDEVAIKEGDFMGIGNKKILSTGPDRETVTLDLIQKMSDEDSAILCIYFGEDVLEETAVQLSKRAQELLPDCEIEVQYGGQPVYSYIISIEQ